MPRFQALRVLARAHRQDREFETARSVAQEALAVAQRLGNTAAEAVMFENLALIESADGRLREAEAWFVLSEQAERKRGLRGDGVRAEQLRQHAREPEARGC